jgi:hypothetical protein
MFELSEAFSSFLEDLNNFDSTYNNLNYSLNNLSIFLKNKVDKIYIKEFEQVDPFYIDTPLFETNSHFIVHGGLQITILEVTPSSPLDDPHELKKVYLDELRKVDDLQRKLVLYKGHMLNIKYIHLQNVRGDNPNVNDSLNHVQERTER